MQRYDSCNARALFQSRVAAIAVDMLKLRAVDWISFASSEKSEVKFILTHLWRRRSEFEYYTFRSCIVLHSIRIKGRNREEVKRDRAQRRSKKNENKKSIYGCWFARENLNIRR